MAGTTLCVPLMESGPKTRKPALVGAGLTPAEAGIDQTLAGAIFPEISALCKSKAVLSATGSACLCELPPSAGLATGRAELCLLTRSDGRLRPHRV